MFLFTDKLQHQEAQHACLVLNAYLIRYLQLGLWHKQKKTKKQKQK